MVIDSAVYAGQIATALRAPEGDFRDWDEIRAWATSITSALEAEGVSGG